MKLDAMSLAAVALAIGLVLSSVSFEDTFTAEQNPPSELQQGFAVR